MGVIMTEAELQTAAAREDLCRYLAACYYEPDPAFEEEGMFGNLVDAARLVDPSLLPHAECMEKEFRNTALDGLLIDYTRLFIGPMDILAKPYGSYWLEEEKTLMGESTMAVQALYAEAEFEMDEEFKELPDHIAAELEFFYLLLFRENEARNAKDATKLSVALELQRRFLQAHLGAWISKFTDAVRSSAQCGFYRELAELTEKFICLQAARIND
jgi:TorA maturation chaperone TorD